MQIQDMQEYNVHNVYILIHLQSLNYFPDEEHWLDKEQYKPHIQNNDHHRWWKHGQKFFPQV